METSALQLFGRISCVALAWLALSSPAHASTDRLEILATVAHHQAEQASKDASEAADKQRKLLEEKKRVRAAQAAYEEYVEESEELDAQAAHTNAIAKDVAAIVVLEQTASTDGLDDAERKSLADLVAAAQQRVTAATKDVATSIANAEKRLEQKKAAEKEHVEGHLKSLRATAKAHKQTAAALRALAKKLAAR